MKAKEIINVVKINKEERREIREKIKFENNKENQKERNEDSKRRKIKRNKKNILKSK